MLCGPGTVDVFGLPRSQSISILLYNYNRVQKCFGNQLHAHLL